MPGGLAPLDFLLVTILLLIIVNGGRRGFLKESSMLLGLVLGGMAAAKFGPALARMIWRDAPQAHSLLVGYLGVLAIVIILVAVAASLVKPVLNNPVLRTLDLFGGMGIGACEGLLLIGAASTAAVRVGVINADTSRLGPFFASWLAAVLYHLPAEYSSVERIISTSTRLNLN